MHKVARGLDRRVERCAEREIRRNGRRKPTPSAVGPCPYPIPPEVPYAVLVAQHVGYGIAAEMPARHQRGPSPEIRERARSACHVTDVPHCRPGERLSLAEIRRDDVSERKQPFEDESREVPLGERLPGPRDGHRIEHIRPEPTLGDRFRDRRHDRRIRQHAGLDGARTIGGVDLCPDEHGINRGPRDDTLLVLRRNSSNSSRSAHAESRERREVCLNARPCARIRSSDRKNYWLHNALKILSLARDMRRRKARERSGRFVAEGVRTVEELLRSPIRIRGALVSPSLERAPKGTALRAALVERGVEVAEVDEREFASAAETDSPQGILAVADIPERTLENLVLPPIARVLVLDGIQDPGNVGTIVRTAAALGAVATVALPGTVDLWNAKVVRSAMGALFTHHALAASWDELGAFLNRHDFRLWSADLSGAPLSSAPPRLALAVGNEGGGLSDVVRERSERLVSIPIEHIESLNVAVAAGILLYALK